MASAPSFRIHIISSPFSFTSLAYSGASEEWQAVQRKRWDQTFLTNESRTWSVRAWRITSSGRFGRASSAGASWPRRIQAAAMLNPKLSRSSGSGEPSQTGDFGAILDSVIPGRSITVPVVATEIESLVGRWKGEADEPGGPKFEVELEVTPTTAGGPTAQPAYAGITGTEKGIAIATAVKIPPRQASPR